MVTATYRGGVSAGTPSGSQNQPSIVNPLLVAMAIIIPLLLLTHLPYARYFAGSALLNQLLQPAVVALALPLYEQMHQIRARWKTIISVCFIGSITAMVSGTAIALWMGATPEIAATILPKSVTTPIAMAVSARYTVFRPSAPFAC